MVKNAKTPVEESVEVRVSRKPLGTKGWTRETISAIRQLKARKVPVVGRVVIRYVSHGTLLQGTDPDDTDFYLYRWVGVLDESDNTLV